MSDSPPGIEFLTVEVVLALHQRQLDRFGGGVGLRDRGLLESALAQPHASFGGVWAHEGLFAMAAAYQFHIVSNHPFVDGNKRTGLLAAQVFLDVNGITLAHHSEALYDLTMGVAEGRLDKAAVPWRSSGSPGRGRHSRGASVAAQVSTPPRHLPASLRRR